MEGKVCELMAWLAEKARVSVRCHSQHSRRAHEECVWTAVWRGNGCLNE